MIIPAGTRQEIGMTSGRVINFTQEYTLNSGSGRWEVECFDCTKASPHTAAAYRAAGAAARQSIRDALGAELADAAPERAAVIQAALDSDDFQELQGAHGGEFGRAADVDDDGASVRVTAAPPESHCVAVVRLFWHAETETDLDLGVVTAGGA